MKTKIVLLFLSLFLLVSCEKEIPSGCTPCSTCSHTGIVWPSRLPGILAVIPWECPICHGNGYFALSNINFIQDSTDQQDYDEDNSSNGDISFKGSSSSSSSYTTIYGKRRYFNGQDYWWVGGSCSVVGCSCSGYYYSGENYGICDNCPHIGSQHNSYGN